MSIISRVLLALLGVVVLAVAAIAVAVSHNSACGPSPTGAIAEPMKAAVYRCYGSADVVRIEHIPRPVPGPHGLLVRVHASSVNPLDWHFLHGEPYLIRPMSGWGAPKDIRLGTDFSGTVEAVGKLVTRFKPGDEVYGGGDGAFGEYLRIPESGAVALKPAAVTFEQAAAVPVAGITALQALRDVGQVRPGQKVLINGAGGGVGTFAVQIAKALGAEVTAVTNTGSLDVVRSIGADHVIDYNRQDFTQGTERYDVIFDLSGTQPLSAYRRVLVPSGIYVPGGNTDKGKWLGPMLAFGETLIVSKFVSQKLVPVSADLSARDLTALAGLMQSGKLKPVIDRSYTLEHVADAIRYQETFHARGKVVVTVQ
ncbi:MAG TPA: NAD(P)-dependent alcohol dehydrogenase [Steroidobacteraceae bacterium]|nr:NAD(P)-dependent alcohol dehydrogenase [Steroidobacteraceae bacterium]